MNPACRGCDRRRQSDWDAMSELYNKHAGQPAFVLGNARSLSDAPLRELEHEVVIACNWVFEYAPWLNPTYYATTEMYSGMNKARAGTYSTAFFCRDLLMDPSLDDSAFDWIRVHAQSSVDTRLILAGLLPDRQTQHFIWGLGGTIPNFSVQLAYWLGCSPIVLLGVDADDRGHVYDPDESGDRLRTDMQGWLITEIAALQGSLHEKGVTLLNGSPGGNLTIPRIEIGTML